MIKILEHEVLCRTQADIPKTARGLIQERVEQMFNEPFSKIYPQFSQALPDTAAAIDELFEPLVLVYRTNEAGDRWFVRSVLEGQSDINLVPNIYASHTSSDRPSFDQDYAMLPKRLREFYRSFDSICVQSNDSVAPSRYVLPAPSEYRMDVALFLRLYGIYFPGQKTPDEAVVRRFTQEIGQQHAYANGNAGEVFCWSMSSEADSLWICHQDHSGSIYHVKGSAFDDATRLQDADTVMDNYMATVLRQGSAQGFEFRSI